MALKLVKSRCKNAVEGYLPNWYGAYREGRRVRTVSLGIPVKGVPPLSGNLKDKGNREFERSRKEAQRELARRIHDSKERQSRIRAAEVERGDAIRETAEIIERKTGRQFEDPILQELCEKYLSHLGERSLWHTAMIRSCFTTFATFAAKPSPQHIRAARTLMEVSSELATAFFRAIAKTYSFSTVKRWSSVLSGAFSRFAPAGVANPFEGARLAAVGRVIATTKEDGEKVRAETVIHHRPLDNGELSKVLAEAKKDSILYHLAITTASTGLRISDAARLRFNDINLKSGVVMLTTAKTGARVGIPIFDYDPSSPNYEPELGEFRRYLESAIVDAPMNEEFVCPAAAQLYNKVVSKNGKLTYPGRDSVYSLGKSLFARALFSDAINTTEVNIINSKQATKTPQEIKEEILASHWSESKKTRVIDIYTRYADGQPYSEIMRETKYFKSTISSDLSAVERLTHTIIKRKAKCPSLAELLPYTRQERLFGKRSASLYSWHSMRCAFVVRMLSNGVSVDTLRSIVGHTTVEQTLEYFNPTVKIAAENARKILTMRNRQPTVTTSLLGMMHQIWSKLSPDERQQALLFMGDRNSPI